MSYAALLLDLDGTLVDSEPRHVETHRTFLATQGIAASDELCFGNIGKGDRQFYQRLIDEHRVTGDAAEWVRKKTAMLMDSYRIKGLALRPGVHDLLERAFDDGLPCVVVTSAERELCALTLEVTGLAKRLPSRVCYEDTPGHKPDPAPYLLAARRMGVPPERCLAVEDSISGVKSAKAAGCAVCAFPGLIAERELMSAGAERVVASLAEVLVPAQPVARVQSARR
jgi:HAD superfamily hydrolase (TIGR01509 family)